MTKVKEISTIILALSVARLATTAIPNLEPIGAAALFGGALLANKWMKYIIPFIALLLGDVVLSAFLPGYGSHFSSPTLIFVYLAFGITVWIGKSVIGQEAKMSNVIKAAVFSSIAFFVITNFGSWLSYNTYPKNFMGLMECYAAGLAFYKNDFFGNFFLNTVIGNVFFSTLAFGIYGFYLRKLKPAAI
ncbi:MAG: hypothetical protein GC181_05630 [Bacteroidetes bacterium]|nr:hypothetical protein [Bacteroidota bacterium]